MRAVQTVESTICREVTPASESHKKSQTMLYKNPEKALQSLRLAKEQAEKRKLHIYDLPLSSKERDHDHHPGHATTLHHSLAGCNVSFIPTMALPAVLLLKTWKISITANIRWRLSWHPSALSSGQISYGMCYLSRFNLHTATVTPQAPLHIHIFHFVLLMLFLS